MKIYISGKITGENIYDARLKFMDARKPLRDSGHKVVIPFDNKLPEKATWEEHMLADIAMMRECDAVYMLQDWESSMGAKIEKNIAEKLGMKVFYQSAGDFATTK